MERCEFEQIRSRNVAENEAYLKELLKNFKSDFSRNSQPRSTPGKKSRSSSVGAALPHRSNPIRAGVNNPYNTRSRTHRGANSSHKKDQNKNEIPRIRSVRGPREIRPPEDITDDEIRMVAMHLKDKHSDATYGSTCHQCRHKSFDMKTICRNKECVGIRGQFCGRCLRNRYGEDAREALKDPNWVCPPCRHICNCSVCRRQNGKSCTGTLIYIAKQEGYDNVAAYLESVKKRR